MLPVDSVPDLSGSWDLTCGSIQIFSGTGSIDTGSCGHNAEKFSSAIPLFQQLRKYRQKLSFHWLRYREEFSYVRSDRNELADLFAKLRQELDKGEDLSTNSHLSRISDLIGSMRSLNDDVAKGEATLDDLHVDILKEENLLREAESQLVDTLGPDLPDEVDEDEEDFNEYMRSALSLPQSPRTERSLNPSDQVHGESTSVSTVLSAHSSDPVANSESQTNRDTPITISETADTTNTRKSNVLVQMGLNDALSVQEKGSVSDTERKQRVMYTGVQFLKGDMSPIPKGDVLLDEIALTASDQVGSTADVEQPVELESERHLHSPDSPSSMIDLMFRSTLDSLQGKLMKLKDKDKENSPWFRSTAAPDWRSISTQSLSNSPDTILISYKESKSTPKPNNYVNPQTLPHIDGYIQQLEMPIEGLVISTEQIVPQQDTFSQQATLSRLSQSDDFTYLASFETNAQHSPEPPGCLKEQMMPIHQETHIVDNIQMMRNETWPQAQIETQVHNHAPKVMQTTIRNPFKRRPSSA